MNQKPLFPFSGVETPTSLLLSAYVSSSAACL